MALISFDAPLEQSRLISFDDPTPPPAPTPVAAPAVIAAAPVDLSGTGAVTSNRMLARQGEKSRQIAAEAVQPELGYIGTSVKSGVQSLPAAALKLVDALNPFTTSESDLAELYKNDPKKLAEMQAGPAAALSRTAREIQEKSEKTLEQMSPAAKAEYGNLKYATLDPDKAAYLSPVKIVGDVLQSLPTTLALGVTAYLTKNTANLVEAEALAAGASVDAARRMAINAAVDTMARVGAVSEGSIGYAQQALRTRAEADKITDEAIQSSPEYKRLIDRGYTPETARVQLSATAAEASGFAAGAADAVLNYFGGKFLGKIIGEGGSLLTRASKGFLAEAGVEGPQSGFEQIGENLAVKQFLDSKKDALDGVVEAIAQGFVIGGVSGGGFAAAVGDRKPLTGDENNIEAEGIKKRSPISPIDDVISAVGKTSADVIDNTLAAGSVDEAIASASSVVTPIEIPKVDTAPTVLSVVSDAPLFATFAEDNSGKDVATIQSNLVKTSFGAQLDADTITSLAESISADGLAVANSVRQPTVESLKNAGFKIEDDSYIKFFPDGSMRSINFSPTTGDVVYDSTIFETVNVANTYLSEAPIPIQIIVDNRDGTLSAVPYDEDRGIVNLSPEANKAYAEGTPLFKILETEFSNGKGNTSADIPTPAVTGGGIINAGAEAKSSVDIDLDSALADLSALMGGATTPAVTGETGIPSITEVTPAAETPAVTGETGAPILQNRDRSSVASISQMQNIAAAPDYGRLGFSRDFANGSPVISGGEIPDDQIGKSDVAISTDGRRIPIQYAVVSANDVLASNTADGSVNKDYGNPDVQAPRAIAGNGRIAGLQAAYQAGTAEQYKAELTQDDLHGVSAEAIARVENPVLVRIMPQSEITANIGDISNTSSNLELSAIEQAKNDLNRVDLNTLEFNENGSITPNAVRKFIQAMPKTEQGNLLDAKGQPTKQAYDRLEASVFAKAYDDDGLIGLFAQAQDSESRLVISALAQLAPTLAKLDGTGAYDIRPIIVDGAKAIINARTQGIKLADAAKQSDIDALPEAKIIVQLFAENSKSNKVAIERIKDAANFAYTEANKADTDMFGAVEKAPVSDVIAKLNGTYQQKGPDAIAEPKAALPRELAGAAPRYSYGPKPFTLDFASDIDKASYIAAQQTPSARDADYVAFVSNATGMTEAEVRAHGAVVKAAIKDQAKTAPSGALVVPTIPRDDFLQAQTKEDLAAKATAAEDTQTAERARIDREAEVPLTLTAPAGTVTSQPLNEPRNQRDIFASPSETTAGQEEKDAAVQKELDDALADLANLLSENTRINLTPEQKQKLLPIMVRIFSAAIEKGYTAFKRAAKFVIDTIREKLGAAVADRLTLDDLQAAYISISSSYLNTDSKRDVINVETLQEVLNVSDTNADLERDRGDTAATTQGNAATISDGAGADVGGTGGGVQTAGENGGGQGNSSVSADSPSAIGERSDQPIYTTDQSAVPSELPPGTSDSERGDLLGDTGIPVDPLTDEDVTKAAAAGVEDALARAAAQKAADDNKRQELGLANVRAALPFLLPGQQEDVHFAEERFQKGTGVMFTNGTGTGKTYTGLGIIKRHGGTDILIVVPSDKIARDWAKSGVNLGLKIHQLVDTSDNGKNSIVVATYANAYQNNTLSNRNWSLVVADESHTLMQNQTGAVTQILSSFHAVTKHPAGETRFIEMRLPELSEKITRLSDEVQSAGYETRAAIRKELNEALLEFKEKSTPLKDEFRAAQRSKVVMLSATPFAYEKVTAYAEGYLFDYPRGKDTYNGGDSRQQFMMAHFGYRMRNNKLSEPSPEVDRGLMQRQFNTWLKREKVLSSRLLDVDQDYDRKFVLVDSIIGSEIDRALEYLKDEVMSSTNGDQTASDLYGLIGEQFDYLTRRFVLEAIKAEQVIPLVQAHLDLGRQAVIYHDYKKGWAGGNPFKLEDLSHRPAVEKAYEQFKKEFPVLMSYDFNKLSNAIDTLVNAFPKSVVYNGDRSPFLKSKAVDDFNSGAANVFIIQSAASAGISLHDTTGKHPRVLFNLGLPTQPTTSIQQEGRIYRVGQASNAMFRYMNTGTSWERMAFATTIAQRASAAENLALGEQARGLLDAFVNGFENSDYYKAGEPGEGTGGRDADRAGREVISEYDRAKAMYFAQQQKTAKTKSAEGVDYYPTPEPIGYKLVEFLRTRAGDDLLEPSAGHGAIARWFPETMGRTAIEPSPELVSRLALGFGGKIINGTFENLNIINKFDGIAMNPPFGTAGRTAIDHLAKAATHLRDGGRIAAIIPVGAADAKFDAWLNGEVQRAVKPIAISVNSAGESTPIYRGDRVSVNNEIGVVTGLSQKTAGNVTIRTKEGLISIAPNNLNSNQPVGKRTETYKPGEGIHLVTEIKLPSLAFARAGTGVMTRIVVLQKGGNPTTTRVDLTNAADINEVFDRLENIDTPLRPTADEINVKDKKTIEISLSLSESKHIHTGETVYTASLNNKITIVNFGRLNALAKSYGGYYSRYTNSATGAVAGFVFPDADSRAKFASGAAPSFMREEGGVSNRLTANEFGEKLTAAFGEKVADRLIDTGIITVVENQNDLPAAILAYVKPGDTVYGVNYQGKNYLVLEHLGNQDIQKVVVHEVGVHYGFKAMLGEKKYNEVLARIELMIKSGNQAAIDARATATAESAAEGLIAEETLARLIDSNPEMSLVRKVIASLKAFVYRTTGIGSKFLTADDLTVLANAAVQHGADNFTRAPSFSKTSAAVSPAAAATVAQTKKPLIVESALDDIIYKMQDKNIDTKRVLEGIREHLNVPERFDVYRAEELYHGRTAKKVDDFMARELKPLLTEMTARAVTMQELEEYLWNRTAEESNILIARSNPNLPDGGSGIITKDARAYLANIPAPKLRAFKALANRVDAITKETRQTWVANGMSTQASVDAMEAAHPNYAPLNREDMENGPGIGQGFSVRGPETARRKGSTRAVVNILANIAAQRERAIVRGEKNRVALSLYGLAKLYPDPDLWTLATPGVTTAIDTATGRPVNVVDMSYQLRDNVIMAKFKDVNGNIVARGVEFNKSNPRAMRMALALKNLDAESLEGLWGGFAMATRYFAAINTQYNVVFGLVNGIRDVEGAMFNLSTTKIAGEQAAVASYVPSALKGIYTDARDVRDNKPATSPWALLWEDFQNEGGATGYRDMFRNSEDRAKALQKEIDAVSHGAIRKSATGILNWLSDYNTSIENAVRLSAYKVALDRGLSKSDAASIAKNISVNFNRKGQIATQAGALYAFFNASVQGSTRTIETLRGPAGKKIILGGLLLGVVQALALAAAGFGDEEPPDFIREKNLVIPIGGKKYLTIPMPLGLHVLPGIGRIATEYTLSGFKRPVKRIEQLLGMIAGSFNPLGGSGISLQTIMPTVFDPFAALATNTDWTGKPIYREDFDKLAPTPGYSRAKDTASSVGIAVAKAINFLTGGTKYKPGSLSPTPDQVDYLIGQATGGVGREALRVEQTIKSAVTGEELPTNKIPVLGRFYGNAEQASSQAQVFYENLKMLNLHEAEIKGRAKNREDVKEYLKDNPEARLYASANSIGHKVSELRKIKHQMSEKNMDTKQIDKRILATMKALNTQVERLQQ